jgi:hypothetical protein
MPNRLSIVKNFDTLQKYFARDKQLCFNVDGPIGLEGYG